MNRRFLLAVLLLSTIAFVPRAATLQRGQGAGRGTATATPSAPASPAATAAPEYGPAKGTLVIVGGGSTDGTTIMEKFIELGGGVDGKFVIVPTNGGNRNADGTLIVYQEEQQLR